MLEALSTPRNRTVAFVYLAVCCASAVGAVALGISDNPPGILLALVAAIALVLAFVHPWRTVRQYRLLFFASLLGLVVFGILHNVLEAVLSKSADGGVLRSLLQGLSITAFLFAILICPPAILVGAVGSVVMFIRSRR